MLLDGLDYGPSLIFVFERTSSSNANDWHQAAEITTAGSALDMPDSEGAFMMFCLGVWFACGNDERWKHLADESQHFGRRAHLPTHCWRVEHYEQPEYEQGEQFNGNGFVVRGQDVVAFVQKQRYAGFHVESSTGAWGTQTHVVDLPVAILDEYGNAPNSVVLAMGDQAAAIGLLGVVARRHVLRFLRCGLCPEKRRGVARHVSNATRH